MFQARAMQSVEGCPITEQSAIAMTVNKWEPALRGMEDQMPPFTPSGQADYVKAIAAMLMENQSKSLLRMDEETRASSVGPFMKYVFPIIRRAALRLVATQIASVQPMTGPIGGIAFYKPKYANDKGQITAGDEINKKFNRWYSSNFVDGENIGTGDGATVVFSANLNWPRVTSGTATLKVNGVAAGTDTGAGTFAPVAGGPLVGGASAINYTTGALLITFGTAPAAAEAVTVEYKFDNELNSRIPQVQLDITLQEIRAKSRKLTSLSSVEASDDLRALWGRDIDQDLVATMADQLATEIDRELVQAAFGAVEPNAILNWDRAAAAGVGDAEHLQSLVIRLSEASQIIHQRTQRSGANWIITSTHIGALLKTIPGFQAVDDGHIYQGGIVKGGVLNNEFMVYIDPIFPQNEILLGYQGPSILDTGLVYSPYIPMEITPNFVDPSDWSMRRSIRTRYQISLIRNEFFSKVVVDNLV